MDGIPTLFRKLFTSVNPIGGLATALTAISELVLGDVTGAIELVGDAARCRTKAKAPRIVHNLEVAGAHTYFAGELEAWGHNAGIGHNGGPPIDPFEYMRSPEDLCEQLALEEVMADVSLGKDTKMGIKDSRIPSGARKMRYTRNRA